MRTLVTGCAGFIGAATCHALLDAGDSVVGLDNVNSYYEPSLKEARLARIAARGNFQFHRMDLADRTGMAELFAAGKFDRVVHLGAQAGVRHSFVDPFSYVDSNMVGTTCVLEGCRHNPVKHLVFASTSSAYGLSTRLPYRETDTASHPMSFYSATKRANELQAHSYSHLYGIPSTGLRFFTVYGPWGRPDMALFKFTRCILEGKPLEVYGGGKHSRDFTFIDDVVRAIVIALERPPVRNDEYDRAQPREDRSSAPWRILNVGGGTPVPLMRYIELIEQVTGKRAQCQMLPAQPGDVADTAADATELERTLGFRPSVPVEVGVPKFVEWFREYYKI